MSSSFETAALGILWCFASPESLAKMRDITFHFPSVQYKELYKESQVLKYVPQVFPLCCLCFTREVCCNLQLVRRIDSDFGAVHTKLWWNLQPEKIELHTRVMSQIAKDPELMQCILCTLAKLFIYCIQRTNGTGPYISHALLSGPK